MTIRPERLSSRPLRARRLELVEVCWRMRAPSGRILECGIYLTDAGTEVRTGYEKADDLLDSHLAVGIASARAYADELRQGVRARGGFQQLSVSDDAS